MTSAVETVTVAVRDLDAAVRLFGETLGLRTESDTRASVSLLGAWRYPVHADVRLVELSCDGYAFGRLRLAHFAPTVPVSPSTETPSNPYPQAGPATLDFHIGVPVERVARSFAAAGYEAAADEAGNIVCRNRDNLAIRLLPAGNTARSLPAAGRISEVASLSILTADLGAAEKFYRDALGLVPAGAPLALRDRQQPSGAIQLQALTALDSPTPLHSPMPGQGLGISTLSLRCSDLDAMETRLHAHSIEVVTRPTHVALGEGVPARVMLVRGPNREWLELIERDT